MENVAGVEEMALWSDFESRAVDGRYRLGKLVRSEGRVGWFETEAGEDRRPALISLTESLNDEEALLERLRAAKTLNHSNVMAVLDVGTTELDDAPLVYAVMEHAEESLEDVLRERALSIEETKQITENLVAGLAAIHAKGLVHGRMEASSVVAASETIKLRSDCIQVVSEGASFDALAARDVRGLGEVIARALTQRIPKHENDPVIQLMAAPYAQIVRKAMGGQATIVEIAALLGPGFRLNSAPVPAPAAKPIPPASPVAAVSMAGPVVSDATTKPIPPVPAMPAATISAPPIAAKPVKPAPVKDPAQGELPLAASPLIDDDDELEPTTVRKSAPYILGALVVLLLLVFFIVRAFVHAGPEKAAQKSAPPAVSQADASAGKTVVVPLKPSASTPTKSAAVVRPTVKPTPATNTSSASSTAIWRVVAYTYNKQDQAEHKVQTIAEKHPELQPSVFSPKGNGAPYLVVLGSPMERDAAFKLRAQAIQAGLPNDTFAQNYKGRE